MWDLLQQLGERLPLPRMPPSWMLPPDTKLVLERLAMLQTVIDPVLP